MRLTAPIGIINASGAVVACTDLKRIGEMREDAAAELSYVGDMIRFGGYTYRPVADRSTRFEYAVFVHGEDENARSICSMAAIGRQQHQDAVRRKARQGYIYQEHHSR